MGLDIVEFIMSVEEAFDIRIPDRVAERIATPRMLIDYVRSQLPRSPMPLRSCHTQRAFYAIRRALGGRHDLRPADTLPRETWASVGRALDYRRWSRLDAVGWRAWFAVGFMPTNAGEAARELVARSPYSFRQPGEGWNGGDVETIISDLIREFFAVNTFNLDDRFDRLG